MLHAVPVLFDFAVFNAPKIIVGRFCIAESSFADCKRVVSFREHLMNFVIDHLDVLLCKLFKSGAKSGQAISDAGVVLKVDVTFKVLRSFFRMICS